MWRGCLQAVPACAFCVSRFGEAHCFAQAVTAKLPDGAHPLFLVATHFLLVALAYVGRQTLHECP